MHNILKRQIKKYFPNSSVPDGWEDFVNAVDKTYKDFDEDRILIERSLEISTRELNDINRKLRENIKEELSDKEELERFNKLSVGREIRMIELKKKVKELEERLADL